MKHLQKFLIDLFGERNCQALVHAQELLDTGPGLTVPDEQLSHGRDSANVSRHTIPAVLHNNQYAVLHDAMPTDKDGVWIVVIFDFVRIWTDFAFTCFPSRPLAATDKGLITPILFQFQIVSLSD